MNNYKQVADMIAAWKAEGKTLSEIVALTAKACMGWPYVWGSYGQFCTKANREAYMNRSAIADGDKELIRKRCQILNSSKSSCTGCKYYPDLEKTRIFDCRGFTRWLLQQVGLTLKGAGATSQWNDASNWSEKGAIADMPKDKVCCVFKRVGTKMEHTGMHIGGGVIIHCSVEVKQGKTTDKGWTHYAIPKGLDGTVPTPEPQPDPTKPTLKKGSRGEYVSLLQTKLIMFGYDLGSSGADGIFGKKTEEAVKKFQKDSGLKVDGIVGKDTWNALDGGSEAEVLYTVRIQHLHKTDAEELAAKYGGTVEKE